MNHEVRQVETQWLPRGRFKLESGMVHLPAQLLVLLCLFCSSSFVCGQEETEAAEPPVTVEAKNGEALQVMVGKQIVVRGTVDKIEATKTKIQKVRFKDTNFFIYISSKDFAAHQDWNLDAWVGKEIYAVGVVKVYYKQLELVVSHPSQLAASADLLKAPAPAVAANPAAGPNAPAEDLTAKLPAATLTQLRFQIQGAKSKRTLRLVSETMEARWEKLSSRSTSTSLLRFNGTSFSTKGREPANQAAQMVMTRNAGKWPAGHVARMIRANDAEGAGWPTGFATALLLEATIQGIKLPSGLKVAGDLKSDGTLTGGHNELTHLLREQMEDGSVVIVSPTAAAVLEDLLLEGNVARLVESQIFVVKSLDEALAVLKSLPPDETASKLSALKQDIASRGVGFLRQAETRAKVVEVVAQFPNLCNAKLLLMAAEGKTKPAELFSLNGTANRLFQLLEECETNLASFTTDTPESKKKLKEVTERFAKLKPRCHSRYKVFSECLETLLEALKDNIRFDPKDTSPRAKKARSALEDAMSKAAAECVTVEGEIGLIRT